MGNAYYPLPDLFLRCQVRALDKSPFLYNFKEYGSCNLIGYIAYNLDFLFTAKSRKRHFQDIVENDREVLVLLLQRFQIAPETAIKFDGVDTTSGLADRPGEVTMTGADLDNNIVLYDTRALHHFREDFFIFDQILGKAFLQHFIAILEYPFMSREEVIPF